MGGERMVAAVELATSALEGPDPRAIRQRLLAGLVNELGHDAAVLWIEQEPDVGLSLLAHVGLTSAEVQLLSEWSQDSTAARLAQWPAGTPHRTIASNGLPWPDRQLHMVAVPEPVTGVLGVVTRGAPPDSHLRMLSALARAYATAVRQSEALRDNQRIVDSIVSELRPGGVVLPDGYSIGHLYRSATAGVPIGGDLYDWFRTDRGQLGLAVGDVSGKGIQAASRTAMAVHSLRAFALPGASPHVAASMLNTIVAGQSSTESFVTLVYVRVTPGTDTVEFVLAGHPPPAVVRGDRVDVLDVQADVPLGVDSDATFALHSTRLTPGDALVLYTDGVTEARSSDGNGDDLLGVAGLTRMLEDLRDAPAQDVADGVWSGVQQWTEGHTADDCAVVVLRRDP